MGPSNELNTSAASQALAAWMAPNAQAEQTRTVTSKGGQARTIKNVLGNVDKHYQFWVNPVKHVETIKNKDWDYLKDAYGINMLMRPTETTTITNPNSNAPKLYWG